VVCLSLSSFLAWPGLAASSSGPGWLRTETELSVAVGIQGHFTIFGASGRAA
jgi:hypothetical protein